MNEKNNQMPKAIILIVLLGLCSICLATEDIIETSAIPAEISGKILDKEGKPFYGDVILEVLSREVLFGTGIPAGFVNNEKKDEILCSGGVFNWSGKSDRVGIRAVKNGYHSSTVYVGKVIRETILKREGIVIYLVPEGQKSKLSYTGNAYIPGINDEKSEGKQCGWSFSKRWYYPVDGDVPVDIIRGTNEDNNRVYTMKEPGGFAYFEGYPKFEGNNEDYYADLGLMTEAPESGYTPTFVPAEHKPNDGGRYYCYFKTPDGKYGKLCYKGDFDYYINPDGSRNLEAGEIVDKGPRNPIEAEWLDEELGEY